MKVALQGAATAESTGPLVEMRFRPEWSFIEGIREFSGFFAHVTFQNAAISRRVRLVMQETLENAVKYSLHAPPNEVEAVICADSSHFEIRVGSRPDPAHLERLMTEVERLVGTDPEAAYFAAVVRAAEAPKDSARLGLARIRYEGAVELGVTHGADGRIRVTATGQV